MKLLTTPITDHACDLCGDDGSTRRICLVVAEFNNKANEIEAILCENCRHKWVDAA